MQIDIVDLRTLFRQPVSYRIPKFQRAYVWGKELQWEPLWNDICNVAECCLEGDSVRIRPHFLGAIVLQQRKSRTGEVAKRLVIDGQQRLTTLQLLIKAIEQAFQSQDDGIRVERLRELSTNQTIHRGDDSANQTKIRQSNNTDQIAFQNAIRNHYSDDQDHSCAISEAYRFFKNRVRDWLNCEPESRATRAGALEDTLTKHLEIVVIDLDENEKPHIIFETLNARREPLTQSDLIKNTVMYEANVIDDSRKARSLWGMFDADEWWRIKTSDKLKRIHIDRFLNYWVIVRTLTDINANAVASEFRKYIQREKNKSEESTIETIAQDIRNAGKIYQDLEQDRLPGIEVFLKRMKAIEFSALTPLLLWLYTSDVEDEQRKKSIEVLESYVVRRMLNGLTTQGLYQLFINLLKKLNSVDSIPVDNTILMKLRSQPPRYVWPGDEALRNHLIARPIKRPARQKMVLEAVEMSLRSDKSESLGETKKLTVEHIMPQKWEMNWSPPKSTGFPNEDEVESRHQTIETIGNLTLIAGKLNSNLSNGKWIEKREKLNKHSSLFLNKTLLDDAPDVWDEAAIKRRSQFLVEKVLKIWPSAEAFMESTA